jgi:O-acetyl-ADP-ribose deacetylase (regulator of RNase III)
MTRLRVVKGDITQQHVDAVVNAANSCLLGGGGVDGAIHRAAGPELLEECKTLNGCKTGEAKITRGYRLPAKYVIHTVGPVWNGGSNNERELLRNAYVNSLKVAAENNVCSIAFPNTSTGVYRFPKPEAAAIAVGAVKEFVSAQPEEIDEILFVCFDDENFELYQKLLQ